MTHDSSFSEPPLHPPTHPPADPPSAAPPPDSPSAGSPGPSARTWILGGVGAVVIAAGAIIGINAASSDSGTVDTATSADAAASTGDASSGAATDGAPADGAFAPGQGRRGGTNGTIESIDGATITLMGQDGAATQVLTTEETTLTSSSEGTVADLQVGDNVRVMGSGSGTELTAELVVDSGDVAATEGFGGPGQRPGGTPPDGMSPPDGMTPPDGAGLPEGATPPDGAPAAGPGSGQGGGRGMVAATGVVESIDGSTMVVKAADGTTSTVTLADTTTITITKVIALSDLATGDTISVRGDAATTSTEGTVTARSIVEGTTTR